MFAHREMPFKLPAFLHEGFFHCLNLLSHFSQLVIHGGYILIMSYVLCKRVHDAKQSKQLQFSTLKIRLTAQSIMKLTMWVGSSHYAVNVIFFFLSWNSVWKNWTYCGTSAVYNQRNICLKELQALYKLCVQITFGIGYYIQLLRTLLWIMALNHCCELITIFDTLSFA